MANELVSPTVLDHHRTLLADARGVESLVESELAATGDAARRLRRLEEDFTAHVLEEERSRLYTEVPQSHPDLAPRIETLASQHAPILAELRSLARACDHATSLPFDSELSVRIRRMIAELRAHEAAEAALLCELGS
jgi:hypothetical protein